MVCARREQEMAGRQWHNIKEGQTLWSAQYNVCWAADEGGTGFTCGVVGAGYIAEGTIGAEFHG